MDNTEFKKILQVCTDRVGFTYCKKNNYYQSEKLIIVINTQKSNYDNSYYVNYGFLLKDIHGNLENPKIIECDIVGRFINNTNVKEEFEFQLSTINSDDLIECFNYNIDNTIIPVINEGINKYFELFPEAIFAAKCTLKEYLERIK